MRVWIDLSNSPHPLLFAPIVRTLFERGDEVILTARNNAQTAELAAAHFDGVQIVGGPSPAALAEKAATTWARVLALRRWARGHKPDVALSHGSYAQILAARSLGIPVVTAMDYEHQPANHVAFRCASRILLPEVFPQAAARRCGARAGKIRRYRGLKELLYLGEFSPDPDVLASLGVQRDPERPLVVARTPPTGALYHRGGNSLFLHSLRRLIAQPAVQCVVLPRSSDQRERLARDLPGAVIPSQAIDARSLMYAADLFLGAGGTMTREAALFEIPTFTVFAGAPPAVDVWLTKQGLMRRLEAPEDVVPVRLRDDEPRTVAELRAKGAGPLTDFVDAVTDVTTSQ